MNNRFRFRVFDKEKNNYVDDSEVELILHNDGVLLFGNWHEDIKVVEQDKFIVEQCTGLKDNCGNLIYEGDIIGDGEDDYVIKWDSNRTMFVAEDIDVSYEIEDVLDPTICVIGNIHEQVEQKDVK